MKAKKGYQIALITGSVLFLLCVFLPVFKLDLSFITGRLSDVFDNPDLWEDGKTMGLFEILKKLKDLNDDVKGMVNLYKVGVILPHVFNLAILVLAFFRQKKAVIANIVLTALTTIELFFMHLFIMPSKIQAYAQEVIDGSLAGKVLSWLNPELSSNVGKQLAAVYRGSLSLGYWIPLILMALMTVTAVLELVDVAELRPAASDRVPDKKEKKNPVLKDISGVYGYAEFPFEKDKPIVIGRNPDLCNIIIQSEKVSRKHCTISYDEATGQYRITDHSTNGTFISGRGKMKSNSTLMIPSGTKICLGEKEIEYFQVG